MKNKFLLLIVLIFNTTLYCQEDFENKSFNLYPKINFGTLPFWQKNSTQFEHMFFGNDSSDLLQIRDIIDKTYSEEIKNCFYIDLLGTKRYFSKESLTGKTIKCQKETFQDTTSGASIKIYMFCPYTSISSYSIINEKLHILYFWEASISERIQYHCLVFKDRKLTSALTLLDLHLNPPYFPFLSKVNKKRTIYNSKIISSFLPNNIILQYLPESFRGGGIYGLYFLNNEGHFQILRTWTEHGQIEEDTITKSKTKNFPRYNFNDSTGKKFFTGFNKIIFKVNNPDGFSDIKEEPMNESKILRTINNNDVIFGIYENDDWVKIEFTADKNGKIIEGGYIHISRLEKISDETNEFVELPSYEEWIREVNAVKKQ